MLQSPALLASQLVAVHPRESSGIRRGKSGQRSLAELVDGRPGRGRLRSDPAQRCQASGKTNPRRAYLQAADVELSAQGQAWIRDRLQAAFDTHGTVPNDALAAIQP